MNVSKRSKGRFENQYLSYYLASLHK